MLFNKETGFEINTPWDSYLSISDKINKATVSLVIRKYFLHWNLTIRGACRGFVKSWLGLISHLYWVTDQHLSSSCQKSLHFSFVKHLNATSNFANPKTCPGRISTGPRFSTQIAATASALCWGQTWFLWAGASSSKPHPTQQKNTAPKRNEFLPEWTSVRKKGVYKYAYIHVRLCSYAVLLGLSPFPVAQ